MLTPADYPSSHPYCSSTGEGREPELRKGHFHPGTSFHHAQTAHLTYRFDCSRTTNLIGLLDGLCAFTILRFVRTPLELRPYLPFSCMTFLSAAWTLTGYGLSLLVAPIHSWCSISFPDVAAHVAEETHNAAVTVPRSMVWATWTSTFRASYPRPLYPSVALTVASLVGFIYLVSLALCAVDIDTLMGDGLGQPLATLFAQVLGTKAGIAFMIINAFCQMACGVAFVSTPSLC